MGCNIVQMLPYVLRTQIDKSGGERFDNFSEPLEIQVRTGVLLLHHESDSRLKRATFQKVNAVFNLDILDETMPIFEATFSEGRFVPFLYEGGGVYRVIDCLFKVPGCFDASLTKDLAQTSRKYAFASARKSFDKNKSHDSGR